MKLIVPWVLFLALLSWGWRVENLFHTVPSYGDVLEVLWGIAWYGDRLPSSSPFFYPLVFHPQGWHVAAFGYAPAMFIGLVPLYRLGGAAFAYNVAVLISFFVAFAGAYRLAWRLTSSRFSATAASLLFTFWGFRWLRVHGHLNILLASSLLPWMVWGLERAFHTSRRSRLWFVLIGVIWALAIVNALYFTWLGGVILVGWVLGRCFGGRADWRTALNGVILPALTALLLSAPALFLFLQANAAAGASFYDIHHVLHWGASLNSFPIPPVYHPWLRSIAGWIYRGPIDESGLANLGLLASVVALMGLGSVWRDKNWWPVLIVISVGLLLALGFTLKWDGETVRCDLLQPLNSAIWQIGHRLKPEFFSSSQPPVPFDTAIPMPGLMLAAVVPFWEGARVLSRYALIAEVGFSILVAQGIQRLRHPAVRVLLAALLLVEIVPPPVESVPFPPPAHPAFEWLRQHSSPQENVVDFCAPQPYVLALLIRGETLWATQIHGRATISGASSVWPAHTMFLFEWLLQHPHPFRDPDFVPLLRYYHADFLLLHMQGEDEWDILEAAHSNEEVQVVECFDPPASPSPWPYPICVIGVLPASDPQLNVLLREGWSGSECWGVWAEGTESHARWVATSRADYRLFWDAFPHCVLGEEQSISLQVNGVQLMTHRWEECEPWSGEVVIPAAVIQIGWNEIRLHYAYAARPIDVTGGENPDPRMLSVGFTRLEVEER